jgi:hypothetical protein
MPSYDRALWALRTWLDSWSGIGHVAVGMARQCYDLQLHAVRREGMARDVLHDRDGTLADERDGHRVGAHVVRSVGADRRARLRGPGREASQAVVEGKQKEWTVKGDGWRRRFATR